jgi:hypothetical protein
MNIYLERESRILNGKNTLIGGAAAGILAIVCLLALVHIIKRPEKKK